MTVSVRISYSKSANVFQTATLALKFQRGNTLRVSRGSFLPQNRNSYLAVEFALELNILLFFFI